MANNKALKSWYEEQRSSYIYKLMAEAEKDAVRKQLFLKLSHEALQQSQSWAALVKSEGLPLTVSYKPDMRTKLVGWLIHQFGASKIKPILAAVKIRGLSIYSNSRLVGYHPVPKKLEEVGASHSGVSSSGGLRAAVFGVNDGLVSIACLVMGVAGAATANSAILLTGVAGLLAGAFSMAAGEYISMRSQREMFEYQIGLERAELAQYPEEEASELALIYVARGMDEADAQKLANKLVADPELGLDTLAREELGLNPDELGSPWLAAISSFTAFVLGGAIPLLPYLFGLTHALMLSVALAGLALFTVGAILSLFTGRNALLGGLRMLLIGGSAGVMTYWIGHLMGASLS
jgi:VIT1/CCC1 family predicted Fe2+/Mn2+ transporter